MGTLRENYEQFVQKQLIEFMNRLIMPKAFANLMPTTSVSNEQNEEGFLIYKNIHVHLRPTIIYNFTDEDTVKIKVWLRPENDYERPYYKSEKWIIIDDNNIDNLNDILISEFNDSNSNNIEHTQNLLSPPNFYLGEYADYSIHQNTLQALLYPEERFPHELIHDILIVITKAISNDEGRSKEVIYDMVRNNIVIKKDLITRISNDGKPYIIIDGVIGRLMYLDEFDKVVRE